MNSELEQKLDDQTKQMRSYKVWKKQEFEEMYKQHGERWASFAGTTRRLSLDDDHWAYLKSLDWLVDQDLRTRQIALAFVANRIIRLRLEDGRAPMDDSLPGEEMTLFEIIRAKLKVLT